MISANHQSKTYSKAEKPYEEEIGRKTNFVPTTEKPPRFQKMANQPNDSGPIWNDTPTAVHNSYPRLPHQNDFQLQNSLANLTLQQNIANFNHTQDHMRTYKLKPKKTQINLNPSSSKFKQKHVFPKYGSTINSAERRAPSATLSYSPTTTAGNSLLSTPKSSSWAVFAPGNKIGPVPRHAQRARFPIQAEWHHDARFQRFSNRF